MRGVDDEEDVIELHHLHTGEVVDNLDPLGAGRVRIEIPNVAEPMSEWAWPLGAFYGPGRGVHFPCAPGADVGVFFKLGDPDAPYFIAGNFGAPSDKPRETPSPVRDLTPTEVTQVAAIEFGDYVIVIDDRPGKKALLLQNKHTGDRIEHDGEKGSWVVKGTSAVIIQADGQIILDAPLITIAERPVGPGPEQL